MIVKALWGRKYGRTRIKREKGKAASAMNANKHGLRGRKWLELARDVNNYVCWCKEVADELQLNWRGVLSIRVVP